MREVSSQVQIRQIITHIQKFRKETADRAVSFCFQFHQNFPLIILPIHIYTVENHQTYPLNIANKQSYNMTKCLYIFHGIFFA